MYPVQPVDEHAPRRPQRFYGLSKVMAEDLAQLYRDRHGMQVCGLRLPLVWGPGLWYQGVAASIRDLCHFAAYGKAAAVEGFASAIDMAYVADVPRAFIALLSSARELRPVYNLTCFAATVPDIATALKGLAPAAQIDVHAVTPALTYPLTNAAALQSDTGYRPQYLLEEALADYIARLKNDQQ
jgi:UDP-glucose 4-epimerase